MPSSNPGDTVIAPKTIDCQIREWHIFWDLLRTLVSLWVSRNIPIHFLHHLRSLFQVAPEMTARPDLEDLSCFEHATNIEPSRDRLDSYWCSTTCELADLEVGGIGLTQPRNALVPPFPVRRLRQRQPVAVALALTCDRKCHNAKDRPCARALWKLKRWRRTVMAVTVDETSIAEPPGYCSSSASLSACVACE